MYNYKTIKIISTLKILNNKSEDEIISILNDKETRIEILDALFNLRPQSTNVGTVLNWPIDKTTNANNPNCVNLKNIFSYKVLKFLYENYKQDLIPLFKSKDFWQNVKKYGDDKVLDFIDEKDLCLNKESVLFGVLAKTKAINTIKDYNNVDEMNNVDKETVLQGLNPDKKIIVSTDTSKINVAPWAIDVQSLNYENMTLDEIFWLYFPEHKGKTYLQILNMITPLDFLIRIPEINIKNKMFFYEIKDILTRKNILVKEKDNYYYNGKQLIFSFLETKTEFDFYWKQAGTKKAIWDKCCAFHTDPSIDDYQSSGIYRHFSYIKKIEFDMNVSSEYGYDCMRFYINGVQKIAISGYTGWHHYSYEINGPADIKFLYTKDSSYTSGSDCGYVKNLRIH